MKVSIVLPTYNRGDVLKDSIDSVLSQSFDEFELIIVDDDSDDNIEEVVKSFQDSRVRYIKHERNKGAAKARNTGIRKSRGEYIAFQDSDDEWHVDKLKKQIRTLDNAPSEVGIVYTGSWRIIDGEKEYIPGEKIEKKDGEILDSLVRTNFIPTQTAMVKKTCFEKHGMFDPKLPRLQDWELWLRMGQDIEFRLIDQPLVDTHMYIDSHSISSDDKALIEAKKRILKKHHGLFKSYPQAFSKHLFRLGDKLVTVGEISEGRRDIKRSITIDPSVPKTGSYVATFLGGNAYTKIREKYIGSKQ